MSLLKVSLNLTANQIKAWHCVLAIFPAETINAAVVEIGLTENRFPEVGDLFQICRRRTPKPYSPHGDGQDIKRPTATEIAAVADRLGLNV